MVLLFTLVTAVFLVACGPLDEEESNDNDENNKPIVTLVTANVDYHYQYDVVIEEYWHTVYTFPKDTEKEVTDFWTPPVKTGYKFLGWTETAGGGW